MKRSFLAEFLPFKHRFLPPAGIAALAFACGIVIAALHPTDPIIPIALFSIMLAMTFFLRHNASSCVYTLAMLVFAGMSISVIDRNVDAPADIPYDLMNHPVSLHGVLVDDTRTFDDRTYFTLRSHMLITAPDTLSVTGLLPVAVYRRPFIAGSGTHVVVTGIPRRIIRPYSKGSLMPKDLPTVRIVSGTTMSAPHIVSKPFSPAGYIRSHVVTLMSRLSFYGYRDMAAAMILGQRHRLSSETGKRFARAGVAHILAVSGLHVGIIMSIILLLTGMLPLSKKMRYLVISILLVIYAGMCGFRPPVVRATIMAVMVLASRLISRPANYENSLFAALILILALEPSALFTASLHLSFAAVWALITFLPPIYNTIKTRMNSTLFIQRSVSILAVTVIAYLATAPFVAIHFGELPVAGLILNPLAVIIAHVIIWGGCLSITLAACGPAFEALASIAAGITGYMCAILDHLTTIVSSWELSTVELASFPVFAGIAYCLWLFSLSRSRSSVTMRKLLVYIPLGVTLVYVWQPIVMPNGARYSGAALTVFDVGQGDAFLLSTGHGHTFLFDTGPAYGAHSRASSLIVPSLKTMKITELDGLFISHFHDDHTGGVKDILDAVPVKNIYCRSGAVEACSQLFRRPAIGLAPGDSLAYNGGGMLVLGPSASTPPGINDDSENQASLVVCCTTGDIRTLMTGDIETEAQTALTSWKERLSADILKVPHHGGAGLSEHFLKKVNPDLSVISCGIGNRYGHPHPETVSLLTAYRTAQYRTDIEGSCMIALPSLDIVPFESNRPQ